MSQSSRSTKSGSTVISSCLPSREEFDALRRKANDGDETARTKLKRILDDHPEIWQRLGDLAVHAQMTLAGLVSNGDFLTSESIQRQAEQLRRDLAGPFPTPLELLAVERVVATRVYLDWVECQSARAEGDQATAALWLKRQSQADRLYHAAVKGLLLIRELLPRTTQVALGLVADDAAGPAELDKPNKVTANGGSRSGKNGQPVNRLAAVPGRRQPRGAAAS